MTTVECIIFRGNATALFPKASRHGGSGEEDEAGQTTREIEEVREYSGLVPSDLALMRFNTRTIIT